MKIHLPKIPTKWVSIAGLILVSLVGILSWNSWFPSLSSWVDSTLVSFRGGASNGEGVESDEDSHAGHDHASHAGHSEESSLELSAQALQNIGLSTKSIQPVTLERFRKTITVPALVVERPGRSRVQVATPMTGVVTHVHVLNGQAVEPGTLLFQIRLTHEDLVNAQTEFIKTLGELEVEEREISRLSEVTNSGAVAGRQLLERQYARDKLVALLQAQREALRLHGLNDNQVNQIAQERRLLRELQVFAPAIDDHEENEFRLTRNFIDQASYHGQSPPTQESPQIPLILQELNVHKGQSVSAGETLCILTDYDELFIEGLAFEQDISQLRNTSEREWTVDAIFQQPGDRVEVVEGLKIAYLSNSIDTNSRTLHFYVHLPNQLTKDRYEDSSRYVEWKFIPGQRLQLRVPVEEWPDQIVLPVDAIAREGAETYIFQQNGEHFDQVPVHVKYRDQFSVVIENDGSIFPGDIVALRGAHQMQMALKNKSGGGADPHAGHNH